MRCVENDSLGKVYKECKEGLQGRNLYLNSEKLKGFYFADFVYRGWFSERNAAINKGPMYSGKLV